MRLLQTVRLPRQTLGRTEEQPVKRPHGVAVHLQAAHLCTQMHDLPDHLPETIGGGPDRPPLTNGAEGLGLDSAAHLLSARRAGDYLLLRHGIGPGSAA
jgi:hypothetical protein